MFLFTVVDLTNCSDLSEPDSPKWLPDLGLTPIEQQIIRQSQCLTDSVINAVQILLREQFTDVGGLQSTLIASTVKGDILPGNSIQILHRTNHWLCIHVHKKKSTVTVYDSMFNSLPLTMVDAVLKLIHSNEATVHFNTVEIQVGILRLCAFCTVYITNFHSCK